MECFMRRLVFSLLATVAMGTGLTAATVPSASAEDFCGVAFQDDGRDFIYYYRNCASQPVRIEIYRSKDMGQDCSQPGQCTYVTWRCVGPYITQEIGRLSRDTRPPFRYLASNIGNC